MTGDASAAMLTTGGALCFALALVACWNAFRGNL